MNNITKNIFISKKLAAIALFSLLGCQTGNARDKYVHINDLLSLDDLFEEIRQQIFAIGPTKEERKVIKNARKQLGKIRPKIEQTNGKVIINIPIEAIDKKSIDIQIEDGVLNAVIPTEYGKVQVSIDNNSLEVARRIEIKQESKEDINKSSQQAPTAKTIINENKTTSTESQDKTKQTTVYYGSLATLVEKLPFTVDISTVKAATKENNLTLTIEKKQHKKINIDHGN